MQIRQKLVAILAAAFVLSGSFQVSASQAGRIPEGAAAGQEGAKGPGEDMSDEISSSEMTTVSGNEAASAAEDETNRIPQQEITGATEEEPDEMPPSEPISEIAQETSQRTAPSETAEKPEGEIDSPVPSEAPSFHAHIEFRMGYTVIGTFTDFTPDIIQIRPLYSLDGENWQASIRNNNWNLFNLGSENEDLLKGLQNQTCLVNADEPLKSYIAGQIDRFYLKLRITKQNGLSYETQAAVIERGGLRPIPEGAERRALFSSAIAVNESAPDTSYRYRRYARYQLTISEDATAEDISALLPDTLPVEVQLDHGPDFMAISVVDCPVTWKPLSLPALSAGESITIPDAAEEILVPGDLEISTPVGTFRLDEPLSLDNPPSTDEVRLVLNVCPQDNVPTGALKEDRDGLKIALRHKPTGAASVEAYVLTEGESEWTKLPGSSLLEEMNDQPSTENSGFALVLRNDQEPYRSYLAAEKAGTAPTPFFIGLKIEGGIYDGKQLILAWPDIYEQLPDLPKLRGGEGNEGNVGADNKDDSTESGQRPNLPQTPDDNRVEQRPNPDTDGNREEQTQNPDGDGSREEQTQNPGMDGNREEQTQNPGMDGSREEQTQNPGMDGNREEQTQNLGMDGSHGEQQPNPTIMGNHQGQQTSPPYDSGHGQQTSPNHMPESTPAIPENTSTPSADASVSDSQPGRQEDSSLSGQRSNLPQTASDTIDTSDGNQSDNLMFAPLMVQAASDAKEKESVPPLSDAKIALEHTAQNDGRMFLLLVATAVAACGGIGVVVCKATRGRPSRRIAGWFRTALRK